MTDEVRNPSEDIDDDDDFLNDDIEVGDPDTYPDEDDPGVNLVIEYDESKPDRPAGELVRDEDGNYDLLKPHMKQIIPYGADEQTMYHRPELFHESVIETVLESWDRCHQMITDLLEDYPYAGLMFNMEKVGGFSYRDRNDEDKGTIIECINAGLISSMVSPGLQKAHYLMFLPDAKSISAMSEFSMFYEEQAFEVGFMNRDGDVWLSDLTMSFKAAEDMINGDITLEEAIVSFLEDTYAGVYTAGTAIPDGLFEEPDKA